MRKFLQATILMLIATSAVAISLTSAITVSSTTMPQIVDMTNRNYPATVTIYPQAGVTGTVEFSTTPGAETDQYAANWQVLGTASAIGVPQTNTLTSPVTALRFTRISGTGAVIGEVVWHK